MKRLLCVGIVLLLLFACLVSCGSAHPVLPEGTEAANDTSPAETVGEATEPTLHRVTVGGVDLSEFSIVYATESNREDCWEDYSRSAELLAAELEALTGIRLPVFPDTGEIHRHEILLGVAYRSECTAYYEPGMALGPDVYRVRHTNGKVLLGGDCRGSVEAAGRAWTERMIAFSVNGEAHLPEALSLDGEKHISRIVCVGDSITQGVGAGNEAAESYPAFLQAELGSGYDVVNLGKGGATMCGASDELFTARSYITKSGYYNRLLNLAERTDIVLIMLGSNDGSWTDSVNQLLREHPDDFTMDFRLNLTMMVRELRERNPDIQIYLFNAPVCFGAREQNFQTYVRPLQKQLAEELKLAWYDMFAFTKVNLPRNSCFSDDIHPNANGYAKMGAEIARLLTGAELG